MGQVLALDHGPRLASSWGTPRASSATVGYTVTIATDIHRQKQTDTTMVTWKTWTRQPQDRFHIPYRGPYSRASVITANGSTHQIGLVCASKLLNYKSDPCR